MYWLKTCYPATGFLNRRKAQFNAFTSWSVKRRKSANDALGSLVSMGVWYFLGSMLFTRCSEGWSWPWAVLLPRAEDLGKGLLTSHHWSSSASLITPNNHIMTNTSKHLCGPVQCQTLFWLLSSCNPHSSPTDVGTNSPCCRWGN